MSEKQEDYARFKADYPEVYERLLEINRALAKLQRAVDASVQAGAYGSPLIPVSSQTDGNATDGPFLEID